MSGPLPTIVVLAALVLAVVVLGYVALARVPDWGLLGLAGIVEAAALVLTVVASIQLVRGDRGLDGAQAATLVGYLLTGLMILPLAFAWSLVERSRGATAVLAVAALTLAFMVARAMQIWG